MDDQISAIFEARDETYREFTKQIIDLLPELTNSLYYCIEKRSPFLQQGANLRIVDITRFFETAIAISVILEFKEGDYNIDGEPVTVTAENANMFKYAIHYVLDLDVVLSRDESKIVEAMMEQIDSEKPTPNLKPSKKTELELVPKEKGEHEFNLDDLTPEQREAYMLHKRSGKQ